MTLILGYPKDKKTGAERPGDLCKATQLGAKLAMQSPGCNPLQMTTLCLSDYTVPRRAIFWPEVLWETVQLTNWILGDLYRNQFALTTLIAKPKATRTKVPEESRCQS